MRHAGLTLAGLIVLTNPLQAQESRETLERARSHYQLTVARHGSDSDQGQQARRKLRESRRAYHREHHRTKRGKAPSRREVTPR